MKTTAMFSISVLLSVVTWVASWSVHAGDRVFDYDRGTYTEIGHDNSVTSGNQVRYFDYDSGTNRSYQVETWQRPGNDGFGARIYDPSSHEYRQLDEQK